MKFKRTHKNIWKNNNNLAMAWSKRRKNHKLNNEKVEEKLETYQEEALLSLRCKQHTARMMLRVDREEGFDNQNTQTGSAHLTSIKNKFHLVCQAG